MISIVVPVYNVQNFLEKCVNSIIAQHYEDIEIILVDDGSTDSSGQMCDEFEKKDSRIRVIHKKNGGLSSARNAGIAIAKGDYIGFVDSDDFVEPEMYGTLLDAILDTGKMIASCGQIIDLWGERTIYKHTLKEMKIFSKQESINEMLLLNVFDVSACDKLYDKRLFETIKYPEGKISEDAAIVFDILDKSNGMVHVGKPFYHYIYRKNSISKRTYSHKRYDAFVNCLKTEQFIKDNYPSLLKSCGVYLSITIAYLLSEFEENPELKGEYKEDYLAYRKKFLENVDFLLSEKNVELKTKVRMLALKTGFYRVFLKARNLLNMIR